MKNTLHIVNDAQKLEDIVQLFCTECGFKALPVHYRIFGDLLEEFEPDLLELLIDATARAPRPSLAYFNACITNCRRSGIYDLLKYFQKGKKGIQRDKEIAEDLLSEFISHK